MYGAVRREGSGLCGVIPGRPSPVSHEGWNESNSALEVPQTHWMCKIRLSSQSGERMRRIHKMFPLWKKKKKMKANFFRTILHFQGLINEIRRLIVWHTNVEKLDYKMEQSSPHYIQWQWRSSFFNQKTLPETLGTFHPPSKTSLISSPVSTRKFNVSFSPVNSRAPLPNLISCLQLHVPLIYSPFFYPMDHCRY